MQTTLKNYASIATWPVQFSTVPFGDEEAGPNQAKGLEVCDGKDDI